MDLPITIGDMASIARILILSTVLHVGVDTTLHSMHMVTTIHTGDTEMGTFMAIPAQARITDI